MSMKPTGRDLIAGGVGAGLGVALWETGKWAVRRLRAPAQPAAPAPAPAVEDSKKKSS